MLPPNHFALTFQGVAPVDLEGPGCIGRRQGGLLFGRALAVLGLNERRGQHLGQLGEVGATPHPHQTLQAAAAKVALQIQPNQLAPFDPQSFWSTSSMIVSASSGSPIGERVINLAVGG